MRSCSMGWTVRDAEKYGLAAADMVSEVTTQIAKKGVSARRVHAGAREQF